MINFDSEKVNGERKRLQKAVRERLLGYVLAAFGLVAALAWNDAVKSAIEKIFPLDGSTLTAKFVYAIVVTIFIAVFAYYISKLFSEDGGKGE